MFLVQIFILFVIEIFKNNDHNVLFVKDIKKIKYI
jgi:hypothetical protein